MNISPKAKIGVLTTAIFVSAIACFYISVAGLLSPFIGVSLAFLLIVLPLFISFYVYKGKLSYLFICVALLSGLCAVIYAVDLSATTNTAKDICSSLSRSYAFTVQTDHVQCSGAVETDGFTTNALSSDFTTFAFWPLFACALLGLGNLILAPIYVLWKKHSRM